MKIALKPALALLVLLAAGLASAGQPLRNVLQLRTVEVVRCEVVTDANIAEVSTFFGSRAASADARQSNGAGPGDRVPGLLVAGIVLRQRDISFPILGSSDPVAPGQWRDAAPSEPLAFFFPDSNQDACAILLKSAHVHVVLSQRAECDTYPPNGICAFDRPIRLVDRETWANYGE